MDFLSTCICDRSTMIGLVSSRSSIFCCLRGVFFGGLTYSSTLQPEGVPGLGSRVGSALIIYFFCCIAAWICVGFIWHEAVVITVPTALFAGVLSQFCISWRPRGLDPSSHLFMKCRTSPVFFRSISIVHASAASKVPKTGSFPGHNRRQPLVFYFFWVRHQAFRLTK